MFPKLAMNSGTTLPQIWSQDKYWYFLCLHLIFAVNLDQIPENRKNSQKRIGKTPTKGFSGLPRQKMDREKTPQMFHKTGHRWSAAAPPRCASKGPCPARWRSPAPDFPVQEVQNGLNVASQEKFHRGFLKSARNIYDTL